MRGEKVHSYTMKVQKINIIPSPRKINIQTPKVYAINILTKFSDLTIGKKVRGELLFMERLVSVRMANRS